MRGGQRPRADGLFVGLSGLPEMDVDVGEAVADQPSAAVNNLRAGRVADVRSDGGDPPVPDEHVRHPPPRGVNQGPSFEQ